MKQQPNVVIIMTDQQRADLSGREGYALDTTPFLDNLARQGTWFDRAYTCMPACVPARVSMLTGRYPSATRVRTNHNTEDATFGTDLFRLMHDSGYATSLCGKNHSHLNSKRTDHWFGIGHQGGGEGRSEQEEEFDAFLKSLHMHMHREPTPFPVECQVPYRAVSRAQGWIRSLRGKPFFLWLSFPEPHSPYQVCEPYYSMFPPESLPPTLTDASALETKGFNFQWCMKGFTTAFPDLPRDLPRARSIYMGMLRMIDDQVRRFVSFLDEEGISDDTIIVFLADHGDFVGEYGLMRKGPELPEALTRIPFQFTGPGIAASAQPHPAHVSIVDLMPTLCEAIGVDLPDGVQGRSLWPLLTGQDYPEEEFASAYAEQGFGGLHYGEDEPLDPAEDGTVPGVSFDCLNSWTQSGQMRMLRKGDWKLVFDMQGHGQLYNLHEDPMEIKDLYGSTEVSAKQMELLSDLMAWTLRVQDPLPLPRRRYVMKRDPHNYWAPHR